MFVGSLQVIVSDVFAVESVFEQLSECCFHLSRRYFVKHCVGADDTRGAKRMLDARLVHDAAQTETKIDLRKS